MRAPGKEKLESEDARSRFGRKELIRRWPSAGGVREALLTTERAAGKGCASRDEAEHYSTGSNQIIIKCGSALLGNRL